MLVTTRVAYYRAMAELIGNQAAADYLGMPVATWRPYVQRRQAPQPIRREIRGGHALPVWTRQQLDEWSAARPGRGAPGRPRARRKLTGQAG